MSPSQTRSLLSWLAVLVSGLLMGLSLDRGMTADEFFSLHLAQMGEFTRWIFYQNHPPLYWIALKHWAALGTEDSWLRLLSVPLALVAVWATGQIAGLWEPRARPLATWFAALFPPLLRWGSEIRMYAWLMGFGGLGLYLSLKAVRSQRSPALGLGLLGLAALSHELGVVWAIASGVLLWRQGYRPRAETLAVGLTLVLLIAIVNVLPFLDKWWWQPDSAQLWEQGQLFAGLGHLPPFLVPVFWGVVGVGLVWGAWHAADLLGVAVVYAAILGITTWVGPNVILARAGLPLYLVLLPLLAIGWTRLPGKGAVVVPLVLWTTMAAHWVVQAGSPMEPIAPLMAHLRKEWKDGDRLIVLSQWMYRIQVGTRYGGVIFPHRWSGPGTAAQAEDLEKRIAKWQKKNPHGRLHFFASHRDGDFATAWRQTLGGVRLRSERAGNLHWWVIRLPPPGQSTLARGSFGGLGRLK